MTGKWDSVSTVANQQGGDKWSKVSTNVPEFWDRVPNPASLAPGLPSFLGGKPKKAPANQWDLPPEALQGLLNAGMTSMDDDQLIDIIKKNVPDAQFSDGGDGKVVVTIQGKPAYLNAPGFSPQDFVRGTTGASYIAAAATPAGMATRGLPLAARALAVGGTSAGGSAVQDVAAHTQGAEKIVDVPRAAVAGAAGIVGEAVLAPAISAAYRFVTSGGARGLYDRAAGRLTEAGRKMLQRAGANANQISDDVARRFAQDARTAANPAEALAHAESQTLPTPVTLTRGQLSQSPRQQMLESQLYKGDMGEAASNIMRAAEAHQQQALRANIPGIQARIAGQNPVVQPGGGAEAAQQALTGQRQALAGRVSEGYEAARAAGSQGGFAAGAVDDLGAEMHRNLSFNFTGGTVPKAEAVLQDFARLGENARGGFVPTHGAAGDSSVMVRSMFDWRARATKAMAGASDKSEAAAIRGMIGQFDDWVERSVDDALFAGNPEAIETWRGAIAARREMGQRFEGGDLIEALTTREPRGGAMTLSVAPEDAANYIFGSSATGWISKSNLSRDLVRMRDQLGADSAAWNALRQEAFLRFARAGEGAQQGGTRLWSGAKFQKAWQDATQNGAHLINILFTLQERNLIGQFSRVGVMATSPVKGGQNFSNTQSALVGYIRALGGTLGQSAARYLAIIGPGRAFNMVRAGNAAAGTPAQAVVAPGVGGAATAIGNQLYQSRN